MTDPWLSIKDVIDLTGYCDDTIRTYIDLNRNTRGKEGLRHSQVRPKAKIKFKASWVEEWMTAKQRRK